MLPVFIKVIQADLVIRDLRHKKYSRTQRKDANYEAWSQKLKENVLGETMMFSTIKLFMARSLGIFT